MKQLLIFKPLLYLLTLVVFASCTKENIEEAIATSQITVSLKSSNHSDGKVYVDIQDVQIRINENAHDSDAWMSLNTINQGAFNISDLNENTPLLLVDNFNVEGHYVYEIRLVLGYNNFVDINSVLHSLDIENTTPSNLVEMQLNSKRRYDMVIDIDLEKSVSYSADEDMMVLAPKLYTAIRQIEY
ncbi:DUF4382 domain-containing protein [Winogradskyella marincola]|uniref:DUF4382 domain-containing protein n=1 Tax=Winogradskyella marincola TaxID=3037795 RepID=A0ABT6G2H4_9FLAO|nr:DUF4382 domain-containing protein [Winogradskyella sp. YYF002]MDG4716117.1 DUF4382 domain-containing protein [Winogradskyella sp. YYF002]